MAESEAVLCINVRVVTNRGAHFRAHRSIGAAALCMASITFNKVDNWREEQRPPPRTDPPPSFGILCRNQSAKKRARTEGEEKKVKVKPESALLPAVAPPSPPSRLPASYKPEDEPTHIPKEAGAEGAAFIHAPSFDYSVRSHLRLLMALTAADGDARVRTRSCSQPRDSCGAEVFPTRGSSV